MTKTVTLYMDFEQFDIYVLYFNKNVLISGISSKPCYLLSNHHGGKITLSHWSLGYKLMP